VAARRSTPLPPVLGGDVISSYDPLFDRSRPGQEQVDRRAPIVDDLVRDLRTGRPVGGDLADLGIRWVVLIHEDAWESYRILDVDPALELQVREPDLDLFEVTGWRGPVLAPDGSTADLRRPVPPILRTQGSAGSVVDVAGAPGWVQGWGKPVAVTADGRLRLPAEGGVVWFWPAFALLGTYAAIMVVAAACARSRWHRFGRILAPRGPRG
jgi:hypothetical protein